MSALVDVKVDSIIPIEINGEEAFRVLCKALGMECVLDEKTRFVVRRNMRGENGVYYMVGNQERIYDSKGDLFVALRNVAVQLFPNIAFKDEPYIYNKHYKSLEVRAWDENTSL